MRRLVIAVLPVLALSLFCLLLLRTPDVSAVGLPIEGSGTVNRIAKFTGAQLIGDSVIREDGSGNVGIGATSPAVKMLVNGGRFAVNASTGGTLGALIANQNGAGPIAAFTTSTGADVKMLVDSDGRVGIGSETPGATLHVVANTVGGFRLERNGEVQSEIRGFGGSAFPLIMGTRGRGTSASPQAVQEGDLLLGLNANGHSSPSAFSTGAALYFEANEDWDGSNKGGRIVLRGRNDGTSGTAVEWMRLVNGDVGIGTDAPTERLTVSGNICATGTIGVCSDARFKEDVEPIENALESVKKLQGVTYSWNDRFQEVTGDRSQERQIGLLAQDVEQVLPAVVSTGRDGYRSVDYGKLTAVLVEAVKAQQAQIERLEAELRELKR